MVGDAHGNHLTCLYEPDQVELQKLFFDCFLMGKNDNGMMDVPPVQLLQRRADKSFYRVEKSSPHLILKRWRFSWRVISLSLSKPQEAPRELRYKGFREHVVF